MLKLTAVAFTSCPMIDHLTIEIIPQPGVQQSGVYTFNWHDQRWIPKSDIEDEFREQFKK